MAKDTKADKVKEIEFNDKSTRDARVRGRGDLLPSGVKIKSPYGKGNAVVFTDAEQARGPSGDDRNTASPGAAGTT